MSIESEDAGKQDSFVAHGSRDTALAVSTQYLFANFHQISCRVIMKCPWSEKWMFPC